ncbi:hypothetical protein DFH29DRAFT_875138 [Suillus ampliporus]|nr:hypothetical protein DFH29DRAFT_875138 [Suillus ampliporus]
MVLFIDQADISIGFTFQRADYTFFAIAGLCAYDFALTFDEEVEFMLNAQWKFPTLLYVICRYLPFAMIFINGFHIGTIVVWCAERQWYLLFYHYCDFIAPYCSTLYLEALTLIIALCNYVLFLISMLVTMALFNASTIGLPSPIPQVTSCYINKDGRILIVAYMLLVIGELEILSFTLYHSWKLYKETGNDSPLVRILIRHNVSYFACGLRIVWRRGSTITGRDAFNIGDTHAPRAVAHSSWKYSQVH